MADVHLLNDGSALRTAVIFFYCSNEGISLLENATVLGLPTPTFLREALAQLKKKSGEKPENKNERGNENE